MPVYTYSALNERGKMTKGVINADSPRAARGKLRQAGLFATDVLETAEAEAHGGGRNVSGLLAAAARAAAGSDGDDAPVRHLDGGQPDRGRGADGADRADGKPGSCRKPSSRCARASTRVAAWRRHWSSTREFFSALFVNMARAGETSGTLPVVMLWLADLTERQLDTRNQITAKMYYPLFMLVIGGLVLLALLTYVVPTVTTIFSHMSATLPLPTRILIAVSDFLKAYWWIMGLAAFGVFLAVERYRRTTRGARRFDLWKIRAPLVGKLALRMAMSRFTRTLGMLLHSDIPLLDSLEIARAVVNNTVLSDAIRHAQEEIREGATIAAPLQASGYFPPLVSHMISDRRENRASGGDAVAGGRQLRQRGAFERRRADARWWNRSSSCSWRLWYSASCWRCCCLYSNSIRRSADPCGNLAKVNAHATTSAWHRA